MTIFGFGSSTPYEQVRQWAWPLRNNKPVILIMILAWTLFQNTHVHVSYFSGEIQLFYGLLVIIFTQKTCWTIGYYYFIILLLFLASRGAVLPH